MNEYTETQKAQDFQFFKDINEDFFAKNGHTFLAIRDTRIIDTATSVPALIEKNASAVFRRRNIPHTRMHGRQVRIHDHYYEYQYEQDNGRAD